MTDEMFIPDEPHEAAIMSLAHELAADLAKRYRTSFNAALQQVSAGLAGDEALWNQAEKLPDASRLKRTRAYKDAAERIKTTLYYNLRRYRQDDEQLAKATATLRELAAEGARQDDPRALAARDAIVAAHVSTRERLEDMDQFFAALFEMAPNRATVLDIGCGVQPLLYPFDGDGSATARYTALDRDAAAIEAVAAWGQLLSPGRLEARRWSLEEGFAAVTTPGDMKFDLALALKFVPVVARQQRELLPKLAEVPAKLLLITGAREAMVKRRSIARREKRTLADFAEQNEIVVKGQLDTCSEIGLFLEPRA